MIRSPSLVASLFAVGALLAAEASAAACTYPKAPSSIPDGATATLAEMVDGQKAVKQFTVDMDAYLKCVDEENPPVAAGTKLTDEQKKAQDAAQRMKDQKHNAAVADEEALAERFNAQIRAFKEAQAAKKSQ
jgi:hypothetical protein